MPCFNLSGMKITTYMSSTLQLTLKYPTYWFLETFKSLEELSWAGWAAKRSITLYLWQCLEAESIEVFCHYLEAVHENFPARAWNCITTTFGPMRNVIRDEPCIYRLKSRKNWLMLTLIVCDQIELMHFCSNFLIYHLCQRDFIAD